MTNPMNGSKVTNRNGTSFVALPVEIQQPIAGGCGPQPKPIGNGRLTRRAAE